MGAGKSTLPDVTRHTAEEPVLLTHVVARSKIPFYPRQGGIVYGSCGDPSVHRILC